MNFKIKCVLEGETRRAESTGKCHRAMDGAGDQMCGKLNHVWCDRHKPDQLKQLHAFQNLQGWGRKGAPTPDEE